MAGQPTLTPPPFRLQQMDDDRKCREQVDRVFRKLDLNQDGVITIEEFMESCLKVSPRRRGEMQALKSEPGSLGCAGCAPRPGREKAGGPQQPKPPRRPRAQGPNGRAGRGGLSGQTMALGQTRGLRPSGRRRLAAAGRGAPA